MKDFLLNIIKEIPDRLKSPVVWFGLVSTVLMAAQISPENMTSWPILGANIGATFSNPWLVGSILVAIFAYLNDPSTRSKF